MADVSKQLLDAAARVREHAHAPYSDYKVGAALLDENGNLHVGCNVENASYPQGSCAEANAIAAMVSAGGKRIAAIAVVGATGKVSIAPGAEVAACTPCGGCRQSILEFSDDDTRIVLVDKNGAATEHDIEALLPASFRLL